MRKDLSDRRPEEGSSMGCREAFELLRGETCTDFSAIKRSYSAT